MMPANIIHERRGLTCCMDLDRNFGCHSHAAREEALSSLPTKVSLPVV